ncbi:MAG: HNH endonuclease [Cyanobacteria bacterium P01_A01_bin.83]
MSCQLCDRSVEQLTVHHLIPRQTVKRKQADSGSTIEICSACHRQIHALYSNLELARNLNTLDKLKSEPKMIKFLGWVKKQDPRKQVRIRRR